MWQLKAFLMAVGNYYSETNYLGKLCCRGSIDPILKNIFNRSEASNTLISAVTMGCSEQLVGGLEGIIFFVIIPFLLLLPRLW